MNTYFVVNPGYGTGPYLRGVELGLAMNEILEANGHARRMIVVPLLYGERQKRILLEEFSAHRHEILLDPELGSLVAGTLYSGADKSFADALRQFTQQSVSMSDAGAAHVRKGRTFENLDGKNVVFPEAADIAELQVNPRISFSGDRVYALCHGHFSEVLDRARDVPYFAQYAGTLDEAVQCARQIEQMRTIHATAHPNSFSFDDEHRLTYPNEQMVPPWVKPQAIEEVPERGVYLTLTGIPGLERLYSAAQGLGVKLYSNDPSRIPGSSKASPRVLGSENILFQFARTGWSSVWLSVLTGTPLVTPDFDPSDDPEIYFNNRTVEELGLGVVYRGQPLQEILDCLPEVRETYRAMHEKLLKEHGTLDGLQKSAEIFTHNFMHE